MCPVFLNFSPVTDGRRLRKGECVIPALNLRLFAGVGSVIMLPASLRYSNALFVLHGKSQWLCSGIYFTKDGGGIQGSFAPGSEEYQNPACTSPSSPIRCRILFEPI